MQSIKSVATNKALTERMTYHSDFCHKHTFLRGHEEVVKPFRKMIVNNKIVCPRCELEANETKLRQDLENQIEISQRTKNYNMLQKHSIFRDKTIAKANFENYLVVEQEEKANKNRMIELVSRLEKDETFNIFLQGHPGVGKSHLGYAALKALNVSPDLNNPKDAGKSCLFVNMEDAATAIKESFSNKQSKYTEAYVTQLMGDAYYLVIDDIGAETGSEHSDNKASDFIHRLIYKVTSSRQDKVTIYTTNLTSQKLVQMYDRKLVSRITRNQQYIVFKETSDKRESLPF
ncbi:AAA family ATPase [Bacillus sp. NPDC077027]|uniref:AAA family ATPase n=1 Tax=Bacillus sp. NPDC077027 TaxID=3390548 RepID=UPI003D028D79